MRNLRRLRRVLIIRTKQKPIILQHRPAARSRNDNRIEPPRLDLSRPRIDIAPGLIHRIVLAPEMMNERPTTPRAGGDEDFDSQPCEQALSRLIDPRPKRRLHASRQQCDPLDGLRWRLDRSRCRSLNRRTRRGVEQHPHLLRKQRPEWARQSRQSHRQPKPPRIRQHERQHRPHETITERSLIRALDVLTGVIDEMHVMHARRASRHARQTRETPIEVLHRHGIGRPPLLEHVLREIDATARAIELIAREQIRRARRGTESAMNAGAQDAIRFLDLRILQLLGREMSLHVPLRLPRRAGRD